MANSGVIVAALAAMGVYYFHHEAPLVDLRPAADAPIEERTAPQTVDARLWQDPFAAIQKSLEKSGNQDPVQKCQGALSDDRRCKSPLDAEDKETLVLAVTVPGAPYQEDAERRRRTRYAVLAGLERAGFVPKDARHIDYFLWQQAGEPARPYTALKLSGKPPSLFDYGQVPPHERPTTTWKQWAYIPYEWFQPRSLTDEYNNQSVRQKVLVLWLEEEALKDHPLINLSWLIQFINGHNCGIEDRKYIKIIGPYSSDMLHDIIKEARDYVDSSCHDEQNKWPQLKYAQFYAYGASAPDGLIQGIFTRTYPTIQQFLNGRGIHLHRTIATDDTLAAGIVSELKLRGVYPDKDDVALISEWDTYYGQTLPKAVEAKFACPVPRPDCREGGEHPWIHKFTYLMGLDGLLPSAVSKDDTKQDKQTTSGEKQAGASDFFKIETDTHTLERPIGQSQYDYLRRISEHLHKIDDDLRKQGADKRIKAIGILGGDVFDKLLILRALRIEFPEALFFTTDFDEAFTIKSELPFTRNLIISSSFGPNLSDWLQGEIPYFRDTYETSAFLATQLALGDLHKKSQRPDYASSDIPDQLRAPRIFEVKRNGEILPFAWVPLPPTPQTPDRDPNDNNTNGNQTIAEQNSTEEGRSISSFDWPCGKIQGVTRCGNIQPVDQDELEQHPNSSDSKPIEKPFPTFTANGGRNFAAFFALGAIFTLLAFWRRWVPNWRLELGFIAFCFIVAALICFFWEPVVRYLTDDGNGEPIALLDGISIWPTVLLRVLGIILAVYFIVRALRDLNGNLVEIARDMELVPHPVPLRKQFTSGFKLTSLFDFSLTGNQENDSPTKSFPLQVKTAWNAYIRQDSFWPRICRSAIYTGAMYVILMFVLVPVVGMPVYPHRSPLAAKFYFYTVTFDWILMQFLTFVVFDATCLCLFFVKKLSRDKTNWPPETLGVYDGRLWLPQAKLIHDWIDLDFVAKRTRCIGSLIYLPFVLIALLILSRSTVFANYAPSVAILVSLGISLFVVFACAFMLWLAAKSARDTAKENLTDGIIRAKNSAGTTYFAEQLESLLSRVNQLNDGAFGPLSKQPLVRALLFPLSSAGWVALIENGMLPGL